MTGQDGGDRSARVTYERAAEQRAAPPLRELLDIDLIVPIRSSSGESPDPERVATDAMRHGTDPDGARFLAAFTGEETWSEFGPPGSDAVRLPARALFERADAVQEPVIIDPASPGEVKIGPALLPFLAAGIDPNTPEALRARRPVGDLPDLAPAGEVPSAFAEALRSALAELPAVTRAWLARLASADDTWTLGVDFAADAGLGDFDQVRNRLHSVANEQLGSRRRLAVTDARSSALRAEYEATGAPFYTRAEPKRSFFDRLLRRR